MRKWQKLFTHLLTMVCSKYTNNYQTSSKMTTYKFWKRLKQPFYKGNLFNMAYTQNFPSKSWVIRNVQVKKNKEISFCIQFKKNIATHFTKSSELQKHAYTPQENLQNLLPIRPIYKPYSNKIKRRYTRECVYHRWIDK